MSVFGKQALRPPSSSYSENDLPQQKKRFQPYFSFSEQQLGIYYQLDSEEFSIFLEQQFRSKCAEINSLSEQIVNQSESLKRQSGDQQLQEAAMLQSSKSQTSAELHAQQLQ